MAAGGGKFNELDSNLVEMEIVLGWLARTLGKVPPGSVSRRCHAQRCAPPCVLGGLQEHICSQQIFPGFVVQFANDIKIHSAARNMFMKFERIS